MPEAISAGAYALMLVVLVVLVMIIAVLGAALLSCRESCWRTRRDLILSRESERDALFDLDNERVRRKQAEADARKMRQGPPPPSPNLDRWR